MKTHLVVVTDIETNIQNRLPKLSHLPRSFENTLFIMLSVFLLTQAAIFFLGGLVACFLLF